MIKGLLNDFRLLSVVGVVLTLTGLFGGSLFLSRVGVSFAMTGYFLFSVVSSEWERLRGF